MHEQLDKKIKIGLSVLALVSVAAGFWIWKTKKKSEETTVVQMSPVSGSASSAIEVKSGAESKDIESSNSAQKAGGAKVIKWEDLYKLDYKTGKMPPELKKLDNTRVRIPGFIVPLSDDLSSLKEFLLVPNAQACIHVPPPPPNLIVYVVLDKPLPIDKVTNPSWAEGILTIETTDSEYGNASYKMKAEKLEEYKF